MRVKTPLSKATVNVGTTPHKAMYQFVRLSKQTSELEVGGVHVQTFTIVAPQDYFALASPYNKPFQES